MIGFIGMVIYVIRCDCFFLLVNAYPHHVRQPLQLDIKMSNTHLNKRIGSLLGEDGEPANLAFIRHLLNLSQLSDRMLFSCLEHL